MSRAYQRSARLKLAARTRRAGVALLSSAREARALDAHARADLIISTGGTYLVEHYNLARRRFELELCAASGNPLVFFTQSLGPFEQPINRRAMRRAFDAAALVLLRDDRSRRYVEELGVDMKKVHVLSDAVFALARPEILEAAAQRRPAADRPLRVAISVRQWRHFEAGDPEAGMKRYRDAIVALVEHLVGERRAEVTFISTCQGIDEYWIDDAEMAARFVEHMPDTVTIDRDFHTPAELSDRLGGFDVVVATRMHMAILALNAGVPVLPIAYEFKAEELFARLGAGEWVSSIERMVGAVLIARFDAFVEALPTLVGPLFRAVGRERVRALEASDLLKGLR